MNESEQRRLVFHGAIVLLVGCLCGVPVGTSMVRNVPEAEIHAWREAHDALIAGGIMLIAIAGVLHLVVRPGVARWLAWLLIAVGYGAIDGLGVAALAGVRGLAPTGPPLNFLAFLGNLTVAVGTLSALPLLMWGIRVRSRL